MSLVAELLSLKRCALPATCAWLAACATPVPQALTASQIPEHFAMPAEPDARTWPDVDWWQGFGDPELASLMSVAQADNQDLRAAAARVLQAEARTSAQRATLDPQLSGQLQHVEAGCRSEGCLQYGATREFGMLFSASYNVDLWGLAHDNIRVSREQLKSARFEKRAVALAVTANVADQYFTLLAARHRLQIARDDIDAIRGILNLITLRAKTGAISNLDLAQERAQLEAVEAQLPGLETAERSALFTLAQLLGRQPEGFEVHGSDLDILLLPAVRPGVPSDLLMRRPDVARAEADLAAGHANVDAARAALFPQISLTGSGGLVSTALRSLLSWPNFGYSYGASLLQTIFDGGRLKAQRALAMGMQEELVANYRGAVLNAFVDTEKALAEVTNTRVAKDHLTAEIAAAREAFGIAQLQYRQGAAALLTVLQAQQTLFLAEDQQAQVTLANYQAAVHLYAALGGGWVEDDAERTQFSNN